MKFIQTISVIDFRSRSMKTINSILLRLVLLLFSSQMAKAAIDIPLKWKLQQWQYVVIVQVGERITNNTGVHVDKKVVDILRGKKEDLPEFESWHFNDLQEGHYYLLDYWNYKAPFQSPRWNDQFFNIEKTNDTFVIKAIEGIQATGFFDSMGAARSDLSLQDFKKLLSETPFEPNQTNTFFYKSVHGEK
jgi:hypothetical protein